MSVAHSGSGGLATGQVAVCSYLADVIDGRYEGGNHMLALELRVDFEGSGAISGDLFGISFGGRDYLASFRTAPGQKVAPDDVQPWVAIFESDHGKVAVGKLFLREAIAEGAVNVSLFIDGDFDGLPARKYFELSAEWQSFNMRRLGIELEQEEQTQDPPKFKFKKRKITYRSALSDAGFDVIDAGAQSRIPRNQDGWGQSELHSLMIDLAKADLSTEEWRLQLLWLGKAKRDRLLGVMFDTSDDLPRQGTAVFEGEIRQHVATKTERKIIQTAVHEIGHALNLAHRFEREVGRADSTSFMNYDWKYHGGGHTAQFWRDFRFTFDEDELEFLRHAPRNQLIPGGAAFHSVRYWPDASGGYTSYLPEVPLGGIRLDLIPPALHGEHPGVFLFGQPVFLEARLTNTGQQPVAINKRLLDPKGSFLQVVVRRKNRHIGGSDASMHFHPMVSRCFDFSDIDMKNADQDNDIVVLQPDESFSDNINITFGSGGFTFAEPGRYEVQVFGSLFINTNDADPFNDREAITASNVLSVHIARPQSVEEEVEVEEKIFRPDVGAYLALGGSEGLEGAKDALMEVYTRRMHGQEIVTDPIVANIVRCLGIDARRKYRRFADGRIRYGRSNVGRAVERLNQLGGPAMCAFDNATRTSTLALRNKLIDELER